MFRDSLRQDIAYKTGAAQGVRVAYFRPPNEAILATIATLVESTDLPVLPRQGAL